MSLATLARKTKAKQRLRTRGNFILNMTGRGNVLGMNAKMSRGNCKGLTKCAGKRAACCVGVGGSQCCEFPHGGQPAPQQGYRVYLNRKSKGAYRPAGGKQCKTLAGCTSAKTIWKQGNNLDASVVTTNRRDNILACNSDVYTAKKDTCTGCPIAKIEDNTITQTGSTQQLGTVKFQPIIGGGGPLGVDFAVGNPASPLAVPPEPNKGVSNLNIGLAELGYIQNDDGGGGTSLNNFRLYFLDDTNIADAGFYFTPSWNNSLWQTPFYKSPIIFTSITFTDNDAGGTGDTLTYFYKDSIGFQTDPIAEAAFSTTVQPCTTRFFKKGFINGSEATIAQQTAFFNLTASTPGGTTGGRNLSISVLKATTISNSITASPGFNNDGYPNINTGTLTPAGEKMFPEPSKARILIEPGVFPEFTIFGGRDNYPIPGFSVIQFRSRGNGATSQGQTVTLLYKDAVKYTENGVGPMLAWTPGSGGAGGFGSPLSYSNGQSIGISGESITSTSLESFFTGAGTDNVEITVIGPFFNTTPPPPPPPCCPVKKNICGCRATDLLRYTRINKSFGCQTTKAVRMGRSASEQIARRRAAVDCIAPKHRSIYLTIGSAGNISFDGCCGNQCLIQGQQYTFTITNALPFSHSLEIQWCAGLVQNITVPESSTTSFSFTVPKFNKNCQPATEAVIKTAGSSIRLSYCKQAYKRPQMLGSCSGR